MTDSPALADVHMHTTYSDGSDSPAAVIDHVRRSGVLSVIAITDHDTIEGALRAAEHAARFADSPAVIVGEEVSSASGHILGLFLRERVAPGLSTEETVERIHAQGGVAVAAHPFWRVGGRRPHGVGSQILRVPFDGVEVLNGGFTPSMFTANRMAQHLNLVAGLATVGGSDAHVKQAIGWALTEFPGGGAAGLRRALIDRTTVARRRRCSLAGLSRYVAWGIERRPRRLAGAAA